jgi:hypothetical protein
MMAANCTFVNAVGLKQYDGQCSFFGDEGAILQPWVGESRPNRAGCVVQVWCMLRCLVVRENIIS